MARTTGLPVVILFLLVPIFSTWATQAQIRFVGDIDIHGEGHHDDSGEFSYSTDVLAPAKRPPAPAKPKPKSPPPPLPPPQYLILALQWPKAICNVNAVCMLIPKIFTIHGLWSTGGADQKCAAVSFDANAMTPITKELRKYWINAKAKNPNEFNSITSNLAFWGYEWKKHGGCTHLKQLDYFRKALDLYKKYDITRMVTSSFTVNQEIPVNTVQLWNKINSGVGAKTQMVCNAQGWLQEFRLYVRTSDGKAVDHPQARKCTAEKVKFKTSP